MPTEPSSLDRRALLRRMAVAGGVIWAAPVIESITVPAAAQSAPRTASASLWKSGNGSANPSLLSLCEDGATSTAGRGSAVFTRTDNPSTICVTITLSTGADAQSRDIFILQSSGAGTCVGGQVTPVGQWAAVPASGPQTFCAPIVAGATRFVVAQQLSGGGGNDGWSSAPPVNLP